MSRRKNSGHRRVLFAGPDDVRNREIFHVAAEHARETGMPLLWAEDEAALSEERHYYGQFYYPLVIVSPLQDGDTDDWLRILAALAYLDAGFLMFFCERPSCFPEAYFRDVFPASRHLLLPERGSLAVIRAFLTLLRGATVYTRVRADVDREITDTMDALYRFRTRELCGRIRHDVSEGLVRQAGGIK